MHALKRRLIELKSIIAKVPPENMTARLYYIGRRDEIRRLMNIIKASKVKE